MRIIQEVILNLASSSTWFHIFDHVPNPKSDITLFAIVTLKGENHELRDFFYKFVVCIVLPISHEMYKMRLFRRSSNDETH